jgi:hypothetical protein
VLAAGYFAFLATGTAVWWVGILGSPTFRGWFELDGARRDMLNAFAAGDVGFVVSAALTAVAIARSYAWAQVMAAVTAGAALYNGLYLVGWIGFGGHGWVGAAAMCASALGSLAFVRLLRERTGT